MLYLLEAIRKVRGTYIRAIWGDLFVLIVFGFFIPAPLIFLLIHSPYLYPPANADEWAAILLPFGSILFAAIILTVTGFYYSWEFDGEQIIRRGRFGRIRQRLIISEIINAKFTAKDRNGNVALIVETKDQRTAVPVSKALKEELQYAAGIHI